MKLLKKDFNFPGMKISLTTCVYKDIDLPKAHHFQGATMTTASHRPNGFKLWGARQGDDFTGNGDPILRHFYNDGTRIADATKCQPVKETAELWRPKMDW